MKLGRIIKKIKLALGVIEILTQKEEKIEETQYPSESETNRGSKAIDMYLEILKSKF